MQTTTRYTIAVFGESDTVTPEIISSWADASIILRGPFSAHLLEQNLIWESYGALIDVRYAPEVMLPLMETLEAKAIPFIFFVPIHLAGTEAGPFLLSARSADRMGILEALAAQRPDVSH